MEQELMSKATMDEVWQYEELFWLNGQSFFRRHMDADALMVFPEPIGVMRAEEVLTNIAGAPRWETIDFTGRTSTNRDRTIVVAYRVTASRPGRDAYHALCSSTYVRRDGAWVLLSHQQTPAL
jgi:hypothetical protein